MTSTAHTTATTPDTPLRRRSYTSGVDGGLRLDRRPVSTLMQWWFAAAVGADGLSYPWLIGGRGLPRGSAVVAVGRDGRLALSSSIRATVTGPGRRSSIARQAAHATDQDQDTNLSAIALCSRCSRRPT
jgi:hypothetical protein